VSKGKLANSGTAKTKTAPAVIAQSASYDEAIRERKYVPYSDEIADKICELVAIRVPMQVICAQPEMPGEKSVYRWKITYPEFAIKLDAARKHRAEARADHIDSLMDELRRGEIDPQTARVLFDAERWQAGKENARYGDKVQAEVTGKDGEALIPPDSSSRQIARAILDVLHEAHLADAPDPDETDGQDDDAPSPNDAAVGFSGFPVSASDEVAPHRQPATAPAESSVLSAGAGSSPRIRRYNAKSGGLE